MFRMTNLKEQEAVDYLNRARSCLHPEEDTFSNLPLIAAMLDIQIAFLQHTQNLGLNELSTVSIDATGFPQLDFWQGNIKNALNAFEGIRAVRGKFLGNFLQQVINGSASGISSEGKELVKNLGKDSILTRVLQRLTDHQISLLTNPPVYLCKKIPGLLCTTEGDRVPYTQDQNKYQFIEVPPVAGLKYVDSLLPNRTPFITYAFLHDYYQYNRSSVVKLMTPTLSIISTSYVQKTDQIIELRRPSALPVYQKRIDISRNYEKYTKHQKDNAIFYEGLQRLHPAVFRAFCAFESARFSDDSRDAFIKALPELNLMIKNTLEYSGQVLQGAYMSQTDAENFSRTLSSKTARLFASLPDDYCRRLYQIALGEALKDVINKSEKLAQPALQAPKMRMLPVPDEKSLIKRIWNGFKSEYGFTERA